MIMMLKRVVGHFVFLLVGLLSLGLAIFISSMFLRPTFSQEEAIPPPPPIEEVSQLGDDALPPPPPMDDAFPPPPPLEDGESQEIGGELPPPPPMEGEGGMPPGDPGTESDPQATLETAAEIDEVLGLLEPFEYEGAGRRDPFKPYIQVQETGGGDIGSERGPLLPLQRFDLNELKLTGIIWDVDDPQAMFIDPAGKTYRIGVNARIGKNSGYVAVIREGEVIVVESVRVRGEVVFNTKVLRLLE